DKAIDAIDEACAHMQAVTEYPARAEELIKQRIAWLKQDAKMSRETEQRDRESPRTAEAPSALERFGAELEALFVGAPATVASATQREAAPEQPLEPRPSTLAPLEADLAAELMQHGIVVRGHDVARVVGLMAGRDVTWETESPR